MNDRYFDLQPGQTLGRNYFILEWLGRGWEGEVYKVEERRTGIVRAAKIFYPIKRTKASWLHKYARKLYTLRSCPIVMQYHHRDIARVGRVQAEIMVSEFIEGILLSDYVIQQPGKRLPPFEALHLLYSLALGVEQIHYLGEYHGDIHTKNIMVRRRGVRFEVHLIDFFDLGRSSGYRIRQDVYDLIAVLYDIIGGADRYRTAPAIIKQIVKGRKHSLIRQQFKTAGQLRLALENLAWD